MDKRKGNYRGRVAANPEPISEEVKVMEEQPKEERKLDRKQRVPLGSFRQKTQLSPQAMAYFEKRQEVVQWFCDRPGRLQEVEDAGFRYVQKDEIAFREIGSGDLSQGNGVGASVTMVMGTHENGQPMIGYLMAQPREYFEEDRELRQRDHDEVIGQIKSGETGQVSPGRDGAYKAGIKIDT